MSRSILVIPRYGVVLLLCALMVSWYDVPVAIKKISISVDAELLQQARSVAGSRGLSALVNDALRVRLQHERLRRLLDDLDTEFGPVPEEERKRARSAWPSPKKKSRSAA